MCVCVWGGGGGGVEGGTGEVNEYTIPSQLGVVEESVRH